MSPLRSKEVDDQFSSNEDNRGRTSFRGKEDFVQRASQLYHHHNPLRIIHQESNGFQRKISPPYPQYVEQGSQLPFQASSHLHHT